MVSILTYIEDYLRTLLFYMVGWVSVMCYTVTNWLNLNTRLRRMNTEILCLCFEYKSRSLVQKVANIQSFKVDFGHKMLLFRWWDGCLLCVMQ